MSEGFPDRTRDYWLELQSRLKRGGLDGDGLLQEIVWLRGQMSEIKKGLREMAGALNDAAVARDIDEIKAIVNNGALSFCRTRVAAMMNITERH